MSVKGLNACKKLEQQRLDLRSESLGNEGWKENVRKQKKRGGQHVW